MLRCVIGHHGAARVDAELVHAVDGGHEAGRLDDAGAQEALPGCFSGSVKYKNHGSTLPLASSSAIFVFMRAMRRPASCCDS